MLCNAPRGAEALRSEITYAQAALRADLSISAPDHASLRPSAATPTSEALP
jgi:hypothetical protein